MMMNKPVALTATSATVRDHERDRWNWLYIIYRTILLLYGRAVAQRIRYMRNIYILRGNKSTGKKNHPVKKIVKQKNLFDWLDLIAKLQDDGTTQEKIGERIGWSREKVKDHVTLRSKIGAEILILAKTFQAGRAPSNGANAPKNERGVTTCDFTEGWFRTSGLYELEADDRMKVMDRFCHFVTNPILFSMEIYISGLRHIRCKTPRPRDRKAQTRLHTHS